MTDAKKTQVPETGQGRPLERSDLNSQQPRGKVDPGKTPGSAENGGLDQGPINDPAGGKTPGRAEG